MADVRANQLGVVSGLLNLSCNLGLVTGASVMGAVFAFGASASGLAASDPLALAFGMYLAFAAAALLIFIAIAYSGLSRPREAVCS